MRLHPLTRSLRPYALCHYALRSFARITKRILQSAVDRSTGSVSPKQLTFDQTALSDEDLRGFLSEMIDAVVEVCPELDNSETPTRPASSTSTALEHLKVLRDALRPDLLDQEIRAAAVAVAKAGLCDLRLWTFKAAFRAVTVDMAAELITAGGGFRRWDSLMLPAEREPGFSSSPGKTAHCIRMQWVESKFEPSVKGILWGNMSENTDKAIDVLCRMVVHRIAGENPRAAAVGAGIVDNEGNPVPKAVNVLSSWINARVQYIKAIVDRIDSEESGAAGAAGDLDEIRRRKPFTLEDRVLAECLPQILATRPSDAGSWKGHTGNRLIATWRMEEILLQADRHFPQRDAKEEEERERALDYAREIQARTAKAKLLLKTYGFVGGGGESGRVDGGGESGRVDGGERDHGPDGDADVEVGDEAAPEELGADVPMDTDEPI